MSTALGRTTVFELAAPRNGLSENSFVESHGEALEHAQRALFGPGRKAKERIRWGLTSEKDQRVASLLRWIHAMSNGLATVGLQKFLETGERGALVTNAGYRTNTAPGLPAQPAFDWVPISELQRTLDQRMQETVARYDPGAQSVVFVFLLSNSENSMAVWHRKLAVPDALRLARIAQIKEAKAKLTGDYAVYVDEWVSGSIESASYMVSPIKTL
ncbi:hypothetical protein B0H21DRAFT_698836 [Amylocystis lapponica]|nr:hypothetical protein B0H21DRAFT_698836 [Amylocystis lapponica]